MLSFHSRPARLCDGIDRREWLRIGGLSALGLSLPAILQGSGQFRANASEDTVGGQGSFGRAKNVIFLWLQGGPPQHETFDPKPDAPAEVRGEFRPIQTNVPGIQFSELLPRVAAMADQLAVIRSLHTHTDLHDASGYWVLTGYPYVGRESRQISPQDWPYLGSVVKMLKPSETAPAFSSVWLPDVMRLNDNVMPAGQTAGFLGRSWDPHRLVCDPSRADFQAPGLGLPDDLPLSRLSARESLRTQINRRLDDLERHAEAHAYSRHVGEALSLLTSGNARRAFDLGAEPPQLRERYGRNKWGQSLLLARRLVEAGARLVHVNWPREGGDEAVNNPLWDTHAQNADRLQDVLCPLFDVGFSALLEDLATRGLLAETLVVAIGEFGRTPKINSQGGRDHWGHVFSFALAGAGIAGGQVFGQSDRLGAYPKKDPIEPQRLAATIVHLLGIDHRSTFTDETGRPFHVTKGEPLYELLGDKPATSERVAPTGNLALVPPYTQSPMFDLGFEESIPLMEIGVNRRLKGWQAGPLASVEPAVPFGARVLNGSEGLPRTGGRHAALGFDLRNIATGVLLEATASITLTQEIRNPRAGTYTLTAWAVGMGMPEDYRRLLSNFRFRLSLFGYTELSKNASRGRKEFASVEFSPPLAKGPSDYVPVTLTRKLRSQENGAAEIEMGIGAALIVERSTAGPLEIPVGGWAFLAVDDFEIAFVPRPRDESVTV